MKRLAILTALCWILAGCAPPAPLQPPAAGPERTLLLERDLVLESGQAVVTLRASAPGADWSRRGSEGACMSVHLDGIYLSDVVLFRGDTSFAYETLLGPVTAGKHKLQVFHELAKSSSGARQVRLDDVAVRTYGPSDPLYPVMAHAPILYGRDDARSSDTPLLAYHEITQNGTNTTIQYTYIFSNEDGGTAPDALMARWGRLTDIEYVYRVTLDSGGQILRAEYQDKDHNAAAYLGIREGLLPLLRVVTKNNLFGPEGTSAYRFVLAPVQTLKEGSREEIMDLNPWTYMVMAQEWEREAQEWTEKAASPATRAVSDPRNYLYVEFRSRLAATGACDSKLAIQVKLRGADAVYSSDHQVDSLRIQSEGWRRASVELPPGTTGAQVESLAFAAYVGKNQPGCGLMLTDVRKAFFLDQGYMPGASVVVWQGEQTLKPDATSGSPATFTIAVGTP